MPDEKNKKGKIEEKEGGKENPFYKKWWFWVIVVLVLIIIGGNSEDPSEDAQINESEQTYEEIKNSETKKGEEIEEEVEPSSYEIVETEDNSIKALGNKSLSDFTLQEIEKLPKNERRLYRVIVGKEITKKQIRPTIEKIISDITEKNSEIDEITLHLYSTKDRAEGSGYDIAKADWSTGGNIGEITPEIARKNIREDYEISINIKDNLEEYLRNISQKETKFELTETERREFYNKLVHCEDVSDIKARKRYNQFCSDCSEFIESNLDKEIEKFRELSAECKKELRKEYNLTEEKQSEITMEGFEKNWPTPKVPSDPNCCSL